ncbi:hypothetical protein JCM5353_007856 [Sporobolomyces roseus]
MSSSASSSGECVVCGAKTEKRCSECAKFGTDWMFFCSREHQKLVWFMHKRVCGEASNPFRWPPLSQAEVERFVELSEIPTLRFGTWMGKWAGTRYGSVESGRKAFRASLNDASESKKPKADHEMIVLHRKNAFLIECLIRITQPEHVDSVALDIITHNPFNYLMHSQSDCFQREFTNNPSLPFFSELNHKYLIYHAILVKHIKNENTLPSYVDYTHSQLKNFCDEVVKNGETELFIGEKKELPDKGSVGSIPWSPPQPQPFTGQMFIVSGATGTMGIESYDIITPFAAL